MATKEVRYQIKNYEKEYKTLLKSFQDRDISPENKRLILEFEKYLTITDTAKLLRRMKYIRILTKCAELLNKDFDKVNRKDIEELIYKIKINQDWEESTKRDYRVFVKRFYKWLNGNDIEYPDIVKWIATTGEKEFKIRQEDLITQEELEKVISEIEEEDYPDEEIDKRKAEFPKIVKYYTEDEDETYYLKSDNEIWIEEDFFNNNGNLLITLTEAYLKTKGIEKTQKEYIQKFEDIVYNYI